jgi:hypothetical protein
MAPTPHDNLIKHALSNPADAAAWLAEALRDQPWAHLVCWEELRALHAEHPGKADALRSDFVFCAPLQGTDVLLLLPIEHQSSMEPRIVQRLLVYVARLINRQELQGQALAIVPVVLYQGHPAWTAPRSLHDALGLCDDVVTAFDGLLPQLPYVLLDLMRTASLLRGPPPVTLALALLREGRTGSAWQALGVHAALLPEVLASRGRRYFEQLLDYAYEVERAPPSPEVATMISRSSEDVAKTFVSYADQLREEGRREGMERGLRQGLEQGHRMGTREGLVHALLMVLRARFGAIPHTLEARITEANTAELHAWLAAAPTASLSDLASLT